MFLEGQTPPIPATNAGWQTEVLSTFAAVFMLGAGAWHDCCQNFPTLNDDDRSEGKQLCRFTNLPPPPPPPRARSQAGRMRCCHRCMMLACMCLCWVRKVSQIWDQWPQLNSWHSRQRGLFCLLTTADRTTCHEQSLLKVGQHVAACPTCLALAGMEQTERL